MRRKRVLIVRILAEKNALFKYATSYELQLVINSTQSVQFHALILMQASCFFSTENHDTHFNRSIDMYFNTLSHKNNE